MRLFIWQGYFVRRGIEIYTDQYLNRATDLDVLALRFFPPFRHYLQIAECKSGASRPLDRIFWLSGVRSFASADNATLVRDATPWDIVDFANRNGVEILDRSAVGTLEQSLGLVEDSWPGPSERVFFQSQSSDWKKALMNDPEAGAFYEFLIGEFRWNNEIASIRYLLFAMRRLTKKAAGDPEASVWRWLLVECFVQLIIFAVFFSGRTLGLRPSDREGLVKKRLKYGTLETPVVRRMMRYAFKLTEQTLESLGVSGRRVNSTDFDFPEPQHSDEVIRIMRLVAEGIGDAYALPSFADYVLHELYLKRRDSLPILSIVMVGSDIAPVIKLAVSICDELFHIEALPRDFAVSFERAGTPALSEGEASPHTPGAPARAEEPPTSQGELDATCLNLFEG
jgi:hypothetical protein